jgi:hypothetical protein
MTSGPQVMCANCLDVIQSEHRHDFKKCGCGVIAIDGGSDYIKVVGNPADIIWDLDWSKPSGTN